MTKEMDFSRLLQARYVNQRGAVRGQSAKPAVTWELGLFFGAPRGHRLVAPLQAGSTSLVMVVATCAAPQHTGAHFR